MTSLGRGEAIKIIYSAESLGEAKAIYCLISLAKVNVDDSGSCFMPTCSGADRATWALLVGSSISGSTLFLLIKIMCG